MIVVEVIVLTYKIGYKQRGQWRYILFDERLAAINMMEKLIYMGYTQVSFKLFKSEV